MDWKSDKYIHLCCLSLYKHFPSLSSILPLAFYFSYAMGQRFQAFIIACIGRRYRTLAVIHNQWLFELAAVKQCLLTMKILSTVGNLSGIRRELKSAESKPDGYWPTKQNRFDEDRVSDGCFFFHSQICVPVSTTSATIHQTDGPHIVPLSL